MRPFTQQTGNEGIWSQNALFKSNTRQAARGIKNEKKEKTSLHPSQDDESNLTVPSALALRKYVDKRV